MTNKMWFFDFNYIYKTKLANWWKQNEQRKEKHPTNQALSSYLDWNGWLPPPPPSIHLLSNFSKWLQIVMNMNVNFTWFRFDNEDTAKEES